MSSRLAWSAGAAVLVALTCAAPAYAARQYYVAAGTDPYNVVIVNEVGDAFFVETEAAYQTWSGCSLFAKSLFSLVSGSDNLREGSFVGFPGSSATCLLRKVRQVGNDFRRQRAGGPQARYLAAMNGVNPVVLDASGTATELTLTPGCVPVLAELIGSYVFIGAPLNFIGKDQLYIFGAGRQCSITARSAPASSPQAPASYANVLADYEGVSWRVTSDGRRIPPLLSPPSQAPAPAAPNPTPAPPAQTSAPAVFSDLPSLHFAAPYVQKLRAKGIISAASHFRPDAPVTRAEFAKLLVGAKNLKPATGVTNFSDVPQTHSLAGYISTAATKGWIRGDGARFRPDATTTRYEAVVMLQRAYGFRASRRKSSFSDVAGDVASVAAAAQEAGLVSGNGGRFEPDRPLTRAEAAKILVKALEL